MKTLTLALGISLLTLFISGGGMDRPGVSDEIPQSCIS